MEIRLPDSLGETAGLEDPASGLTALAAYGRVVRLLEVGLPFITFFPGVTFVA